MTAWDLPRLIRPLPIRQRPYQRQPRLLAHYPAIVEYIHNSRFVTASQVQRRLPNVLPNLRTTQYQLANLVHLGYLATAPVRSTSPNFPYVYTCTGRGVRLVENTYANHGLAWHGATTAVPNRGITVTSILHELLLSEFDLSLWQSVQSRGDLQLPFTSRHYFHRDRQLRFTESGTTQRVVPDLGFLLRVGENHPKHPDVSKMSVLLYFVELDNGTMPLKRLREKFSRYATWAASAAGEHYLATLGRRYGSPRPLNFRLLLIAHNGTAPGQDDRRLTDLLAIGLQMPRQLRDRLWLTTAATLQDHQDDRVPLGAPLWLRARDCQAWLPAMRKVFANENTRPLRKYMNLRHIVGERLAALPRHALFPRLS